MKSPPKDNIEKSKKLKYLPVVLTPTEIQALLRETVAAPEPIGLIIRLLYGTGMRLMEAVGLRVKDVDLNRQEIVIHGDKDHKDRITMLPDSLAEAMRRQLAIRREWHDEDMKLGKTCVWLPDALAAKYPNAFREWGWQYIFAARKYSMDPHRQIEGRHHIGEKQVQRYVRKGALAAGITKPVSPQTLRHSFATHLLQSGYDIHTVQKLLGHKDVAITMIYKHILNKDGKSVVSPLDNL